MVHGRNTVLNDDLLTIATCSRPSRSTPPTRVMFGCLHTQVGSDLLVLSAGGYLAGLPPTRSVASIRDGIPCHTAGPQTGSS